MLPVRVALLNQGRLNIWTESFYRNFIAKGKETLLTFRKGHNEIIYPQISFILCIISRTASLKYKNKQIMKIPIFSNFLK